MTLKFLVCLSVFGVLAGKLVIWVFQTWNMGDSSSPRDLSILESLNYRTGEPHMNEQCAYMYIDLKVVETWCGGFLIFVRLSFVSLSSKD